MLLHQYWQTWKSKLETIVDKHGARLLFPNLKGPSTKDGEFHYQIDRPVLIYNAPQKGSSQRTRKNAIFVDGGFAFVEDAGKQMMIDARCSVSIFEIRFEQQNVMNAHLFDALHFDIERVGKQKSYHPIFHVQRGKSTNLTDALVSEMLIQASRARTMTVNVNQSQGLGSPYLRLPSPQLDLFSVMVMLVADFFCNPEDKNVNMEVLFADLLSHLCDDKNAARSGLSSQSLYQRSEQKGWNSSAHWYKESAA